jgi:hypothetical protein
MQPSVAADARIPPRHPPKRIGRTLVAGMIIEPVPTAPRGPLRRLAGVLAAVLPVLLLVAVVAGGALGRDPAEQADPTEQAGQDLAATPDAAAEATVEPAPASPPASASSDRAAAPARFPITLHRLPVRDVFETLRRQGEDPHDGLVAVAGYLSIRELPVECTDRILGPHGALCHRDSLLADVPLSPFFSGGVDWPRIGAHLHPEFPVGIRLPHTAARTLATATGPPIAVVVLGRFGDERAAPCRPQVMHCGDEFVVERVAWIDGEEWFRTTVFDPLLDLDVNDDGWRERRMTARAHMDGMTILTTAYLLPETLKRVDRRAAEALEAETGRDDASAPVWYVLGMHVVEEDGERVGRTRWILVDDGTGEVITSGGEIPASRE